MPVLSRNCLVVLFIIIQIQLQCFSCQETNTTVSIQLNSTEFIFTTESSTSIIWNYTNTSIVTELSTTVTAPVTTTTVYRNDSNITSLSTLASNTKTNELGTTQG